MKKIVDIHEVATNLDHLIEDAEHGKPFTIAVDGKPLVKVSHIGKKEMEQLPKADAADGETNGAAEK